MDHLAYDASTQRLFVVALEHGSLQVVDLERGERVGEIDGLDEPQGIVLLSALAEVAVACGGDGTLRAYGTGSLVQTRRVDVGPDADNVRLDARTGEILVAHGEGAIALFDAATFAPRGSIAMPGHPESFQLRSDGARLYANVPDGAKQGGLVVVADRAKRTIAASWRFSEGARNYPMALATLAPLGERGVVISVCRSPAKLVVLDARDGNVLSATDCVGDADDVFYDEREQRVLVVGGGGTLELFALTGNGACVRVASVPTASGARTGLFVPGTRRVFVAVPGRAEQNGQRCEVLEFALDG